MMAVISAPSAPLFITSSHSVVITSAGASEKDTENILISPVVVASALGLVALGGKASTASQVKSLLKADKLKDEQLHAGLGELLSEVSDPAVRNVTWKIRSRLYGPSSITFTESFLKKSKKLYNCEHSKINFKDKKSAMKAINEWGVTPGSFNLLNITTYS